MSGRVQPLRRVVPPFGWPFRWRAVTVAQAKQQPRFILLNRYPRQIIGVTFRLPDSDDLGRGRVHRALSVMWARPARWWL